VKSIKGGVALSLGLPFVVAFVLAKTALPLMGASFEGFLFLASILWLFTAAVVIAPAVVRVAVGRRWGRWPWDHDRAWRKRQRTAGVEGLKIAVALLCAFGLLLWAELSFVSKTPARHHVSISLPVQISSLTVKIPRPQAADCPERGVIDLSYSGAGAPRVTVGDSPVEALERGRRRSSYRIPIRSERSTYSCYFDFPKVVSARGDVPVHLYIASRGSASDSTPAPNRYLDGFWGWRCKAMPRGTGCAVLAVVNDDPASEASSLALVVASAAFAIVISLLVSVARALWRGWVDDAASAWRILRREVRSLLSKLASDYSGFRWVTSKLKSLSRRAAIRER
jgi:hypothetical protein